MTPWLALLKRPKILTIIALVTIGGAYIGWQHIKVANLETVVARHEATIASKDNQIRSLVSSVDSQNAEVQRWQEAAQARQEAAQEAQRQARAARREADETIGRIKALNPQSCEEGVDLINREVIGL